MEIMEIMMMISGIALSNEQIVTSPCLIFSIAAFLFKVYFPPF